MNFFTAGILATVFFFFFQTDAVYADVKMGAFKCTGTSKESCASGECQPVQSTTWTMLNTETGSLSRCDARGCDEHEAVFELLGVYWNIHLPGKSFLAKFVAFDDDWISETVTGSEYIEVATAGTSAIVMFGECTRLE